MNSPLITATMNVVQTPVGALTNVARAQESAYSCRHEFITSVVILEILSVGTAFNSRA